MQGEGCEIYITGIHIAAMYIYPLLLRSDKTDRQEVAKCKEKRRGDAHCRLALTHEDMGCIKGKIRRAMSCQTKGWGR